MRKPKIGDTVIYRDRLGNDYAAVVSRLGKESLIGLVVFDFEGSPADRIQNVQHSNNDSNRSWHWPESEQEKPCVGDVCVSEFGREFTNLESEKRLHADLESTRKQLAALQESPPIMRINELERERASLIDSSNRLVIQIQADLEASRSQCAHWEAEALKWRAECGSLSNHIEQIKKQFSEIKELLK